MKSKTYWQMRPKELAAATKEFDEPFIADQSRPLTPAEQKEWQQVSRKQGRLKSGEGFKRVSVSLERGLLERVTELAKERHISRSRLVANALEQALAQKD